MHNAGWTFSHLVYHFLDPYPIHRSKTSATRRPEVEEPLEELQEEIQQLKQILKEKQKELFLTQRSSYKRKLAAPAKKNEQFIKPEVGKLHIYSRVSPRSLGKD